MAFILFDTETTGIGEDDRICQIALGVIGPKTKYISEYCKPPLPISIHAMSVHGITNEKITDAPTFSQLESAKMLAAFNSTENIIIAHNAKFDIDMIAKEGVEWRGGVIDTLRCAKHLLPDEESHALQYLRYSLSIYKEEKCQEEVELRSMFESFQAHDALFDIYILKKLFTKLFTLAGSAKKMLELTSKPITLKIIRFGKYKNCTFEEISRKDKGYLKWLAENSEDSDVVYTARTFNNP